MTNDDARLLKKDCWKNIADPFFWFDRFGWFMLIFGIVDLAIFHRTWIGWTIIVGSVCFLITLHMKKNKYGMFKPAPEIAPEAIRDPTDEKNTDWKEMVRSLIGVVIILAIGVLLVIGGFKMVHWSNTTRNAECYTCPNPDCNWIFNKAACADCNASKLDEQEYGPNNLCNDMGSTEMAWKIGMMLIVMGILIPVMFIFMLLYALWHSPKTDCC